MNANELAEILESDSKHTSGRFTYSSRYIADIATMLRTIPELLEALEGLNEVCKKHLYPCPDKPSGDWAKVMKADLVIAKAKGEQA